MRLTFDPATGKHSVDDGAHRITAARGPKRRQVRAVVRTGTYLDSFGRAARANDANGVPATNADKRHRVEVALQHPEMSRWSNVRIAEVCGVHHSSVARIRPAEDQPSQCEGSRTIGRDGRARPARPPRPPRPNGKPKDKGEGTPEVEDEAGAVPEAPTPPDGEAEVAPPANGTAGVATTVAAGPAPVAAGGSDDPPAGPEPPAADRRDRWGAEEQAIMGRYEAWPADDRSYFVMKLEGLGSRLRILYHPQIQRSTNVPLP